MIIGNQAGWIKYVASNFFLMKKTWAEFEFDVVKLAEKMSGFQPDVIIASLRGGLVPAGILAEKMRVKDVRFISIERVGEERRVACGVQGEVKGLKLLLVEDDLPTGKGPPIAKKHLEERGAFVKTSAVYVNSISFDKVDFYAEKIDPLPDLPWKPSRSGDRVF